MLHKTLTDDFNKYVNVWKQTNDPTSLIVQLTEKKTDVSISYDDFHQSPWASSYEIEDEHAKKMIVSIFLFL